MIFNDSDTGEHSSSALSVTGPSYPNFQHLESPANSRDIHATHENLQKFTKLNHAQGIVPRTWDLANSTQK